MLFSAFLRAVSSANAVIFDTRVRIYTMPRVIEVFFESDRATAAVELSNVSPEELRKRERADGTRIRVKRGNRKSRATEANLSRPGQSAVI